MEHIFKCLTTATNKTTKLKQHQIANNNSVNTMSNWTCVKLNNCVYCTEYYTVIRSTFGMGKILKGDARNTYVLNDGTEGERRGKKKLARMENETNANIMQSQLTAIYDKNL